MVTAAEAKRIGSGHHAPARLLWLLLARASIAAPQTGAAQTAQPVASLPVPDQLTLSKLLWSTMAAVDQANKTGNYSVLRDLGSPGFQTNNDAASLAAVFADIRARRLDLSDTLLVAPSYEFAPAMVQPGVLRMRGRFPLRPTAVAFDLVYQWDEGWRLHGIAILPVAMNQPVPR